MTTTLETALATDVLNPALAAPPAQDALRLLTEDEIAAVGGGGTFLPDGEQATLGAIAIGAGLAVAAFATGPFGWGLAIGWAFGGGVLLGNIGASTSTNLK